MAYTSRGTSEVVVGGGQKEMFTVNLERGTVVAEVSFLGREGEGSEADAGHRCRERTR